MNKTKRMAFGIGIVIAVLAAFVVPAMAGPNTVFFTNYSGDTSPGGASYVELWVNVTDSHGSYDPDYAFGALDINVTFDSSIGDITACNPVPGHPWDGSWMKSHWGDSWVTTVSYDCWAHPGPPYGLGPGVYSIANYTIEGNNPGIMDLAFSHELPRYCAMTDCVGEPYPNQTWEDGTYTCGTPAQTYTISGTVIGVDTVNITNQNTGVEYAAELAGDDYTLILDVPGEVEAGNELLIVACDVPSEHESNCNVTTHTVVTAPGEETVDLTLNHYCLNYYPDYPYYTQEEDNWSGPAVMKACIAHYIAPPTQTVLNETGIANNHGNHAGLLYVDPRGMETTMDSYLHPYSHNYGTFAIPVVEDALHRICYWQKLGPGAVPAYGDYSNWMAVRGIHTSKKPTDYSAPYDYDVYGFWVNDPNPSGIGENSYKTATEFTTDYYIPTIDLQVSAWNETYMSVLEPPEQDAEITIVAAKPRLADVITPELMAKPMMLYGARQLALENVVRDDESRKIVKAATDGVTEELVPYDSEFAEVFAKTVPGKPMLVSSENGNYYIVPFNVPMKVRPQVKRMPIGIEKPNGFKKLGRGGRRADKIDFKPIPIEPIRVEKTLVVVIVDVADGSFKEASWVADPVTYLPVSKIEAMKLALGEVLDELHVVAKKDARDLEVVKQRPTIELVYMDASPYYPVWKITVNGKVIYVSQDGTVSCDAPEEPLVYSSYLTVEADEYNGWGAETLDPTGMVAQMLEYEEACAPIGPVCLPVEIAEEIVDTDPCEAFYITDEPEGVIVPCPS